MSSLPPQMEVVTVQQQRFDYGMALNSRYYFLNALEMLDAESEYFIDRRTAMLYFIPPGTSPSSGIDVTDDDDAATDDNDGGGGTIHSSAGDVFINGSSTAFSGDAFISVANSSFVVRDVSHVTFKGILFGFTKGTAVSATNVHDMHFDNCTIGNSGSHGLILRGTNSSLRNSHIFGTGCNAVSITGGDQASITRGNIDVSGNRIHDFGRLSRSGGETAAGLLWYLTYRGISQCIEEF